MDGNHLRLLLAAGSRPDSVLQACATYVLIFIDA